MKRLISLVVILAAICAHARQILPREAARMAESCLGASVVEADSPVFRAKSAPEEGRLPFYVFNAADGRGFAIIAADDNALPVLGYSDNGTFDGANLPPQFEWLLENYARQLSDAGNAVSASSSSGVHKENVNMTTALWGQNEPYNSLMPQVGSVTAPTGCVATAMAIVMKYHSWPERYDWASMPQQATPETNVGQLPQLMKDLGESVEMFYGAYESLADMNWVGHKLQQDYSYSPDCQYITARNFTSGEWTTLLNDELLASRPVIYSGSGSGRHAFVIDGCNDDLYHVNWGWDGLYNGYFALSALRPNEQQDFSDEAGMVINITPDHSGRRYSKCFSDYGYFWATQGYNTPMNVSVENIETGEPFDIIHTMLTLPAGFVGQLGLALVDKDGAIKEVIGRQPRSTWSDVDGKHVRAGMEYKAYNVKFSVPVASDDQIWLAAKDDNDSDFLLVLGTIEMPSSRPVKGVQPRTNEVRWHLDEGIQAQYLINNVWYPVADRETTVDILTGETLVINGTAAGDNDNRLVNMRIEGTMLGGHINISDKNAIIAFQLSGDEGYDVTMHLVELIDKEVNLSVPGTLKDFIPAEETFAVRSLKIVGKIDATDLWYIRDNFGSLYKLDLEATEICAVEASDFRYGDTGVTEQRADVLPAWALSELRNLEELRLPSGLKEISFNAMMATNLKSISIPAGVEVISVNVFQDNARLEFVEMLNPAPVSINDCIFTGTLCPAQGLLYVPAGSKAQYAQTPVWQNFAEIIEGPMPENPDQEIEADGLLYRLKGSQAVVAGYTGEPTVVDIPATISVDGRSVKVSQIADRAFADCLSLVRLSMSDNISQLGTEAFSGCGLLEEIMLSPNVTVLPSNVFQFTGSLNEVDLTHIEIMEAYAFAYSGIRHIYIPAHTQAAGSCHCFVGNDRLEKFEVHPDNPCYKAVDGVLYHIVGGKQMLESMPRLYQGEFSVAEGTHTIGYTSIEGVTGEIPTFTIGSSVEELEFCSIFNCPNIRHIVLPPSAFYNDGAIIYCPGLEALTFTGNPLSEGCIAREINLSSIYIDTDDVVDLDDRFLDSGETFDIFVGNPAAKLKYSGQSTVYVPGEMTRFYEPNHSNVAQMWSYAIDRANGLVQILPALDAVVIEGVTVDGVPTSPGEECLYPYLAGNGDSRVEVKACVDGRFTFTAVYTPEINSAVPDTELQTALCNINSASAKADVYNMQGVRVMRDASDADLSRLPTGLYIVGGRKIVVK